MNAPVGQDWRAWIPAASGEPFALCRSFPPLPGLWDLAQEPEVARHWVGILRENFAFVLQILERDSDGAHLEAGRRVGAILASLLADVERGAAWADVRTVHDLTRIRENLLRAHGIADPYRAIKAAETERCLDLARQRIAAAWEAGSAGAAAARLRGRGEQGEQETLAPLLAALLAGNLFDLGSRATQEAYRRGELDTACGERFLPGVRRWLAALPAAARTRLFGRAGPGEPADLLLFADNAGPDFLLGVLPAALYWAQRRPVRIVVNSEPASSDVTWPEASALLARLAAEGGPAAAALAAARVELVASGTGSPGIDLRHVGRSLNEAARSVAWILIDGQGRGVETNWATRFACPVLRVAMVKDPLVAEKVGLPAGSPLLRWDEPDPR